MPCPQHPDIFENGNVRPHVSGVFRHQKRGFSKTVSRVEFLKTSAYRFRFGRTKTEVFEYDDFTHHRGHGL